MHRSRFSVPQLVTVVLVGCGLASCPAARAQSSLPATLPASTAAPTAIRLTLDEAKDRALANSKVINLALVNVQSKGESISVARADYFPKVFGSSVYFNFDQSLGQILTTRGRQIQITSTPTTINKGQLSFTINKPGLTVVNGPSNVFSIPLIDQNLAVSTVAAAQPITDLLLVRQAVKVARADEQIAQSQVEQARRAIASGVEQLYWGLVIASKIRAGAAVAVHGAEELAAKVPSPEVKVAYLEAKEGLESADYQISGIQDQLRYLLDLPCDAVVEAQEPPFPSLAVTCIGDAAALAVAASPEVRQAEQDVVKAEAGLKASKLAYMPHIFVTGGYMNQQGIDVIQQNNIGFVGVAGTVSLFEGGKRRHSVLNSEAIVAMANLKLGQTRDDVAQKAQKAFREYEQKQSSLKNAVEMVGLRKEAEKGANTLPEKLKAGKEVMLAEVAVMQAELGVRMAAVQLNSLTGK
jgi:outer membrane protein TolC